MGVSTPRDIGSALLGILFGKSKFVIRVGYGQFYNRESFDAIAFRQTASNPPFAQSVMVYNTLLSDPATYSRTLFWM